MFRIKRKNCAISIAICAIMLLCENQYVFCNTPATNGVEITQKQLSASEWAQFYRDDYGEYSWNSDLIMSSLQPDYYPVSIRLLTDGMMIERIYLFDINLNRYRNIKNNNWLEVMPNTWAEEMKKEICMYMEKIDTQTEKKESSK